MIAILDVNNKIKNIVKIYPAKEEKNRINNYQNAVIIDDSLITEDFDLYEIVNGQPQLIQGWETIKAEREAAKQQEMFNQTKQSTLLRLSNQTKNYIETYYPEIKQRSDINDKEFWGAWLIAHFPSTYTTDNLYQKFFTSATNIINGLSDFATEIANLKEVTTFADTDEETKYNIAIEQLLKVSVRQGWVQACKTEYAIKKAMVDSATTIDELNTIQLNFIEYPL